MVSECLNPTTVEREDHLANDYTRHVILKLRPGAVPPGLPDRLEARCIDALSAAERDVFAFHIGARDIPIEEVVALLGRDPAVEWCEGNSLVRLSEEAEPFRSTRPPKWGLKQSGATAARGLVSAHASAAISIAVVDWGVFAGHRDLASYTIDGRRFTGSDSAKVADFTDDNGHGTMLVGTIASIMEEVLNPQVVQRQVTFLAAKFIDARALPTAAAAAQAIDWAVDQGARVINASWDVGIDDRLFLRKAIERAEKAGVLFVAAAGNSGRNNVQDRVLPASYDLPNVVSVMAVDKKGNKPGFSNYGANVHIAAPGVGIGSLRPYLKATPANRPWRDSTVYRAYSGTSVAAAHVSGAAALLMLRHPTLKPVEIRQALIDSATPSAGLKGLCQANGSLNLQGAIEELQSKAVPT